MKSTTIKLLVSVIGLVLLGALAWFIYFTNDNNANDAAYTLNPNIPAGYAYTSPTDVLPEKHPEQPANNDGSVFVTPLVTVTYHQTDTILDCHNGAIAADQAVVEFFNSNVSGTTGGSSRTAVRCGNEYIIIEYLSHTGPMWAGPFSFTAVTAAETTRTIGDVDGDGSSETVQIINDSVDAGDYFAFIDSTIPPLPATGGSCLHLTDLYLLDDIDEDGVAELGLYSSSCASRWKGIKVLSLQANQWVEVGAVTYDVGYAEPSIPERITKVAKDQFKLREIISDTATPDSPVIDREVYFDMNYPGIEINEK